MVIKIISFGIMFISYILITLSMVYGLNKAKKVHNVSIKDVKNEIPNGYILRTICSLIYLFCIIDWIVSLKLIAWSYIPFPQWVIFIGLVLLSITVIIFWWIHITLNSNYHGPLKLHRNHKLITNGPYAIVRHPTYVGFPLLHTSYFLITFNYILLLSGFVMSFYVNHYRILIEEKLLLERFGNDYLNYKNKVGMYFPKI